MKTNLFLFFLLCFQANSLFAQPVQQRLAEAVRLLEADSQTRHAIVGICVADSKTGKIVYEHNSQTGLAPASTQKLFTSAAAFDLLGKDFRYVTSMGYGGRIIKDSLAGYIYFHGSGDPTLGSWRYASTKPVKVLQSFADALRKEGIHKISGSFSLDESGFDKQSIPDGWIWQDIGNYYGAGAWGLNWKENQYDIILKSYPVKIKSGDSAYGAVDVIGSDSGIPGRYSYTNQLGTAGPGSGDNAYIFLPMEGYDHLLKGTIPVNENHFTISGAVTDPPDYFMHDLRNYLSKEKMLGNDTSLDKAVQERVIDDGSVIYTYYSPTLDSIVYWFLRRSINLYGEALVKTFAHEKLGYGSTEWGVELLKKFWAQHGIEKTAINIIDGSGLSPQNRVTTDALVKVLQYARTCTWYPSFYNAMPEYNGMKLKSGSIVGARAFAGYHTAKDGTEYTVAIIVNNYGGSAGEMVKKMYKVLDVLK